MTTSTTLASRPAGGEVHGQSHHLGLAGRLFAPQHVGPHGRHHGAGGRFFLHDHAAAEAGMGHGDLAARGLDAGHVHQHAHAQTGRASGGHVAPVRRTRAQHHRRVGRLDGGHGRVHERARTGRWPARGSRRCRRARRRTCRPGPRTAWCRRPATTTLTGPPTAPAKARALVMLSRVTLASLPSLQLGYDKDAFLVTHWSVSLTRRASCSRGNRRS